MPSYDHFFYTQASGSTRNIDPETMLQNGKGTSLIEISIVWLNSHPFCHRWTTNPFIKNMLLMPAADISGLPTTVPILGQKHQVNKECLSNDSVTPWIGPDFQILLY